jgi:nicotinamide-nucleotide amidase
VLVLKAEILAIGDELCYGRVYDTNSFWMADQLTRRGVLVQRITCLRDSEEEIIDALKSSVSRGSDFVFVTGGLGPTQDDRTLAALSRFSGRRIRVSETVLSIMSERRKIPHGTFQPHQLRMASTLEDSECLPNPMGWAPVTIVKLDNCTLFALPGPPKEVQACFTELLAGRVQEATGQRSYARRLQVTMYESELVPLIGEVYNTVEGIYLKPLVSEGNREQGLAVEIITFATTDTICKEKYETAFLKLKALVESKGRKIIET